MESIFQDFHVSPTALPANTSTYFRRPNRIVKPSSRGGSPRNITRRRTTAAHATCSRQTSTVESGVGRELYSNWHDGHSTRPRTRPTSWHPSTLDEAQLQAMSVMLGNEQDIKPPPLLSVHHGTTEVNGLVTPISYPNPGEPFIYENFTPLEELPPQGFNLRYGDLNEFGVDRGFFWTPGSEKGQPSFECSNNFGYVPGIYNHQSVGFNPVSNATTAPPTPDFLPIQNFSPSSAIAGMTTSAPNPDATELVGMGLYDPPSPPQAATVLNGAILALPIRTGAGKGLKLEETFQPSTAEEEDDDDEEEEEEDEEDDNGADDIENPLTDNAQSINDNVALYMPYEQTIPQAYTPMPAYDGLSLANHSFFFETEPDSGFLDDQYPFNNSSDASWPNAADTSNVWV